jgi:hypothetical protein
MRRAMLLLAIAPPRLAGGQSSSIGTCRRPNDVLAGVDVVGLIDGEDHGSRDRIGRDRDLPVAAHDFARARVRDALGKLRLGESTSSRFVTSTARKRACPPSRVMAPAMDSSFSVRRAPSTTRAPRSDSKRAVASPIPLLAPVMTTTFPSIPDMTAPSLDFHGPVFG